MMGRPLRLPHGSVMKPAEGENTSKCYKRANRQIRTNEMIKNSREKLRTIDKMQYVFSSMVNNIYTVIKI